MEVNLKHNERLYPINVIKRGEELVIDIGNKSYAVAATELKAGHILVSTPDKNFKAIVSSEADVRYVFWEGHVYRMTKVERTKAAGVVEEKLSGNITAPISGKVVKVAVEAGQEVAKNQDLMIIEAMKMEYRVRSPFDTSVLSVHFKEGVQVEIGELLVELQEPEPGPEDKEGPEGE